MDKMNRMRKDAPAGRLHSGFFIFVLRVKPRPGVYGFIFVQHETPQGASVRISGFNYWRGALAFEARQRYTLDKLALHQQEKRDNRGNSYR